MTPRTLALTTTVLLAAIVIGQHSAHAQDAVNNGATRAFDRAAGTDVSGAYPTQRDGTPGNPPGTAVERTFDRAAGTNTSGAYPTQGDGTPTNPPGTAIERTYDRAANTNTSGAYPANGAR